MKETLLILQMTVSASKMRLDDVQDQMTTKRKLFDKY